MSGLIIAVILIILPALGMLLNLFLSRLDDSFAANGKTQDWLLFIFIFLPLAILSFILLKDLHTIAAYSILWLPKIEVGIRINEVAILFACIVSNLSALLGLYSISYMSYDRSRTRYWFFYLFTLTAIMLAIFSNNLFWLFGGMSAASIGAFFLISHWHKKSGEEGNKAGKAAIRYLVMSIIGDIFILIAFSFILYSFKTSILSELFENWQFEPDFIGGSSSTTRALIKLFLVFGALIKSAQLPLLLWPIGGDKDDQDLAKAPLPISCFLTTITVGLIGLFLLGIFNPIFSATGVEYGTTIELFSNTPFIVIGWFAIGSILFVLAIIAVTDNINRLTIGLAVIQISFSFLAFSSGNELGFVGSVFHIISGIPTTVALTLVFGSIIESLRIKDISRVSGLKNHYPNLYLVGLLSLLGYIGIFPGSTYFSKDMIYESLRTSTVPSSTALLIVAIISSILITFVATKGFMKLFFGELNSEYSIRPIKPLSSFSIILTVSWSLVAGLILIVTGYPAPTLLSGILNKFYVLNYSSPLFSNWTVSIISLLLTIAVFGVTFYLYKDGKGSQLSKIRDSKFYLKSKAVVSNGFYLDKIYEVTTFKPFNYLSKLFAWTRIRAPFASVIWATLAIVVLFCTFILVGGI